MTPGTSIYGVQRSKVGETVSTLIHTMTYYDPQVVHKLLVAIN